MMKYAMLLFAAFVFLPILFSLLRTVFRDPGKKVLPVLDYVQKRGYRLLNPSAMQIPGNSFLEALKNPALRNLEDASSDITDIEGLARATGGWLAFTCQLRSKEVTIFNCSTSSTNSNSGPIPHKVAKIKAEGLPRFSLGKNSLLHTFMDAVDKLAGQPNLPIAVDQRQFPNFSAHYWITGTDTAAVSAFLSPEKLRFLEAAQFPGILSTNAKYLVYLESGTLHTEPDFDSFVATAEKLVAALF
jgi:hypothetical protein